MKKTGIIIYCSFFIPVDAITQNHLSNGDFELYTSPPVTQGEITKALYWDEIVISADYMNSTYPGWCTQIGTAFSGTGYAGFATYGLSNPAAEAFGQDIAAFPVTAGDTFNVGLFAKKGVSPCWYSSNCGGVSFIGFSSPPAMSNLNIHAEDLPGATVLWTSALVADSVWMPYYGTFVAPFTVNYVVVTNENIVDCPQYIYVDKLFISLQYDSTIAVIPDPSVVEFPNVFSPNKDSLNSFFTPINLQNITQPELIILNRWGETLFHSYDFMPSWNGKHNTIDCPEGVYYFIFNYIDSRGNQEAKNGYFTLLR